MTSRKSAANPTSINPETLSKLIKHKGPAPVHLWNPPYCGEMDIRIANDGTWYHQGSAIKRLPLVRLFSSILKREGDSYFLVTPVEKVGIKVDDCPFIANILDVSGEGESQTLQFTLNTEETVIADAEHKIIVTENPVSLEPHPIIHVRDGLNALLARNVFYQLVDISRQRTSAGKTTTVVQSNNSLFELGSADLQ